MRKKFKHIKGSLLLEALLSVVILSVSIALIVQSMTTGLRAAAFSQDATAALIELVNFMTRLKRPGPPPALDEPGENTRYSLDFEGADESDLKRLDVSIHWVSGTKKQSIDVSTYAYPENKK